MASGLWPLAPRPTLPRHAAKFSNDFWPAAATVSPRLCRGFVPAGCHCELVSSAVPELHLAVTSLIDVFRRTMPQGINTADTAGQASGGTRARSFPLPHFRPDKGHFEELPTRLPPLELRVWHRTCVFPESTAYRHSSTPSTYRLALTFRPRSLAARCWLSDKSCPNALVLWRT